MEKKLVLHFFVSALFHFDGTSVGEDDFVILRSETRIQVTEQETRSCASDGLCRLCLCVAASRQTQSLITGGGEGVV